MSNEWSGAARRETYLVNKQALIKALDEVAAVDSQVGEALVLVGYPDARTAPGGFPALLSIIVNQQISKEAARAILGRLEDLMPGTTAEGFLAQPDEALQAAGLSRPKIRYGKGIAEAVASGSLPIEEFPRMPDEEIIAALTGLKGIGLWSAEIYCMFSLGRPDLFPGEDIALQEALKRLKGLDARPTPTLARELAGAWSPWRSAMSVFLWHYYRGAPA